MYLPPKGISLVVGPPGSAASTVRHLAALGLRRSDLLTPPPAATPAELCAVVKTRLAGGYPAMVDTTNRPDLRQPLVELARRQRVPVFEVRCDGTNDADTVADADVSVTGTEVLGLLWGDGLARLRDVDIIGDVHGQHDALVRLLERLGYHGTLGEAGFGHREGRLPVFVGDLVNKGPRNLAVLDSVASAVRLGQALCVRGNHEQTLVQFLGTLAARRLNAAAWRQELTEAAANARPDRKVTLAELADDVDGATDGFRDRLGFLNALPYTLVLDGGSLVVVHAAITDENLHGFTAGDEDGRSRRESWALRGPRRRRGTDEVSADHVWMDQWSTPATVVRGHVVHDRPTTRNGVVSIDTGAGDGETLTAMRWPEGSFTSVDVHPAAPATATN